MNSRGGRTGGGGRRRGATKPRRERAPVEELHPTADPPNIESFREFTLGDEVQECIASMGITAPTPIQALAIQPVLDGKDVIAKAETGTGKTLAFGAPIAAKVDAGRASVLALVLCPTRELAQQVAVVLEQLGKARGLKVALVVGGDPMHPQIDALKDGAQIVVGTPGRVQDLYNQRFLSFPWTEFVVLDEADEMLEIGFLDDVRKILSFTPEERQTLLFSATFPPELLRLARENTRDPIEVATASGVSTVDSIEQSWVSFEGERLETLIQLIKRSGKDDVFLIFCERRTEVDQFMRRLERLPFSVKALHGGYDQAARFRVMSAFRTGDVKALLATDVASRGLDIAHVTHVVNMHPPKDVSVYTHRIGRTGRAGRTGAAITLVDSRENSHWRGLLNSMNWEVAEIDARELQRDRRPSRRREEESRDDRPGRSRRDGDSRRRDEDDDRPRRRSRDDGDREPRREREPRGEREPRREREPRSEREPRREREPRSEREPRREREPRSDREPRREREPRSEREPRREREPRSEREPRREREPRDEREPRREREPRNEREPRREREPRGDREPRREREPRNEREPRRERESGRDRDSRGERPSRREPERERGRDREAPAETPPHSPYGGRPLDDPEPRSRRRGSRGRGRSSEGSRDSGRRDSEPRREAPRRQESGRGRDENRSADRGGEERARNSEGRDRGRSRGPRENGARGRDREPARDERPRSRDAERSAPSSPPPRPKRDRDDAPPSRSFGEGL